MFIIFNSYYEEIIPILEFLYMVFKKCMVFIYNNLACSKQSDVCVTEYHFLERVLTNIQKILLKLKKSVSKHVTLPLV